MGNKKNKKVDTKKVKKSDTKDKTGSNASSCEASDHEDEDTNNQQDETAGAADDAADADANGDMDDDEFDDDDDDDVDDTSTGATRCKHAGKSIKGIRDGLKKVATYVKEVMEKSGGGGGSKSKSKSSSSKDDSSSTIACWMCSACGTYDSQSHPTHFVKKHEVALDLFTLRWKCFVCKLDLNDDTVAPKVFSKMKTLSDSVERQLGANAKKSTAAANAAARAQTKAKEEEEKAKAKRDELVAAVSGGGGGLVAKGLRNLGNTCFMNSVLQCLAATPSLYGSLIYPSSHLYSSDAVNMTQPLQAALFNFLHQMAKPPPASSAQPTDKKSKHARSSYDDSMVVSPSSVLSAVQTLNPMFRGARQHDAHELLRVIMNGICMEKEEEQKKKKQAVCWKIVKTWTKEQVLRWISHWPLPEVAREIISANLDSDHEFAWDGTFVVNLLENWNGKTMKKPRLILHAGIVDVEQKRIMARQLQKIKDGVLPDVKEWKIGKDEEAEEAEEEKSNGDSSSDSTHAPLHPFSTLLTSTFIHSLFGGVARNTVECLVCHTVSVTHEYFLDLSLAIEAPRVVQEKKTFNVPPVIKKTSYAAAASSASSSSSSNQKGRMTKSARKLLKKQQQRAAKRKSSGAGAGAKEGEEEEDGEDDGDEEEGEEDAEKKTDETKEGGEKKDDIAADATKTEDSKSSEPTDSAPVATDASPTSDATPASSAAASDLTIPATTAVPVTDASVEKLTNEVEQLTIEDDAQPTTAAATTTAETTEAATPATSDSVSAVAASSIDSVAASTTTDSTSSVIATPSAPPSAAQLFLQYARLHRTGFARLSQTRASLQDCLAAYTDADLLTGNNRYGCKVCSARAHEEVSSISGTTAASEAAASSAPSSSAPAAAEPAQPAVSDAAEAITDAVSPPTAADAPTTDPSNSEVNTDTPASDSADPTAAASSTVDDSMPSEPEPPISSSPPPPIWLKQDAIKRCQILVAPPVLTINFKRFHATGSGRNIEKSSKGVDFPLCFNLKDYMTQPIDADQVKPFEFGANGSASSSSSIDSFSSPLPDVFYHLVGIVSHGGGTGGGHYVAYVRKQRYEEVCAHGDEPSSHSHVECQLDQPDLTKGWYYCSDSDVRTVSVQEVMKVQAYILFYERA